ncbi:MAG: hypothetical protein HY520_04435 [Candidatus Aenigmarchaeota archaeon]|nr:hypothetical protein [Candidatus Aenigmarchaeota archaeon]
MGRTELMSYRFNPAGHERPNKGREYSRPDAEAVRQLGALFEELERTHYRGARSDYRPILSEVERLHPSVPDAHALVLDRLGNANPPLVGLFLSAVYHHSPDDLIVFDLSLDNPPSELGYKLTRGKTLVNTAEVGTSFGGVSSGTILNYGKAGFDMGGSASGTVINLGEADDLCGQRVRGVLINYGSVSLGMGDEGGKRSFVINAGEAGNAMGTGSEGVIIALKDPPEPTKLDLSAFTVPESACASLPRLVNYLGKLREKLEEGRSDYRALLPILRGLGPSPERKLRGDFTTILREAGYAL